MFILFDMVDNISCDQEKDLNITKCKHKWNRLAKNVLIFPVAYSVVVKVVRDLKIYFKT